MRVSPLFGILLLTACSAEGPRGAPTVELGNTRAAPPATALRGAWSVDFGRDPGAPLGPMGVIADGDGFAVLDQENLRLLRYDAGGAPLGEVPIPTRSTLDAVALPRGGYGLLAYHRTPSPHWLAERVDGAGELLGEEPVAIDQPTGIFELDGAILVEDGHASTVDLSTGTRYPGRPDGAGRFLSATRDDDRRVTLTWQDARGTDTRKVVLASDRVVGNLVALDPIPAEVTGDLPAALVTLLLFDEGPPPAFEMRDPELRAVVVDQLGHPIDEVRVEIGSGTTQHRHVATGVDGAFFQLRTDDRGVEVARVDLEVRR